MVDPCESCVGPCGGPEVDPVVDPSDTMDPVVDPSEISNVGYHLDLTETQARGSPRHDEGALL